MSQFVLSSLAFLFLIQCTQTLSTLPSLNSSVNQQADFVPEGGIRRIIGGEKCEIAQFPFLVALISHYTESQYCAGSLISWGTVLSASHCFPRADHTYTHDIAQAGTTLVRRGEIIFMRIIDKIHRHPKFDPQSMMNDVAVLKLKAEMFETAFVKLARLPPRSKGTIDEFTEPECHTALVMGWGSTEASKPEQKSRSLQRSKNKKQLYCVELPIVKTELCMNRLSSWMTSKVYCTMFEAGGKDACQGDSGGPMVCVDEPDTILGIVSGGKGCGEPKQPAFFTRVDQYLDFIEQHMNAGTSLRFSTSTARPSYIRHIILFCIICVIIMREYIAII